MERKDFTTVGDVLRDCLEKSRLQSGIDDTRAAALWSAILGEGIASQCRQPVVRKGVLTVRIPNAALRQELQMRRGAIARAINDTLGKTVVEEIRLTT